MTKVWTRDFSTFRYGEPAGEVASGTFNTVGNVISIRSNAKVFTAKGLAKRTAKATGTAMVEDFRGRRNQNGIATTSAPAIQSSNAVAAQGSNKS